MDTYWLQLKFQDRTTQLTCGDARITAQGVEITPSCAGIGELRSQVTAMKRELDTILKQAEREFARCQGPIRAKRS
jgi:hypothetical protein